MEPNLKSSLKGLKVASFESRRAQEMANLIRNYDGEPLMGPSLREIPLSENTAVADLVERLERGEVDFLLLLTGVGTRALVGASGLTQERTIAAMRKTTLVARGPKPMAVLKDLGLKVDIPVPEPNTWREVLAALGSKDDLRDRCVAIQEYGVINHDLMAALEDQGARVMRVPVYRWTLPEDVHSLERVIRQILEGAVDVALFTNARQVEHLFLVAGNEREGALRRAFRRILVASVGPVCSEALEQFGLPVDIEPEHPKMGHLVAAVASRAVALLAGKRQ